MTTSSNLNDSNPMGLYGTDSLCFDKSYFMKKDFNVDTFVQVHQASGQSGLDILRDDLGVYLKILRSAMIDLINRDYADFVNLSTNLTGLDRLIDALKTPLGQLREEVLNVEQMLTNAIESVSADLERRHTINHQKSLLHRLKQISVRLDHLESLLKSRKESYDLNRQVEGHIDNPGGDELVDRIATEINHLNFLVAQCEGASLLDIFKPRVESVSSFVEIGLERGLKEGIQGCDKELLLRTLRTYANLGTLNHAHQQVQLLIRNQLEEVINDTAFKCDPRGLRGMFEKVLSTVKKICNPLISITQGNGCDIVTGYSFLEQSAWPEIVRAIEVRMPHVYNPGNPKVFHERCKESLQFLDWFEELLISNDKIEAFRNLPDYEKFLDLWNLPVYFQVRYQEIGQVLESSLSDSNKGLSYALSKDYGFILKGSDSCYNSLCKCFDSEVFLLPLLHRFWKLALLIMARYRTWVSDTSGEIKTGKEQETPQQSDGGLKHIVSSQDFHSLTGQDLSYTMSVQNLSTLDKNPTSNNLEGLHIGISLLRDIDIMTELIGNFYPVYIEPLIGHLPEDKRHIMKVTLQQQASKISNLSDDISQMMVKSLTVSVIAPLKQVSDTPRIYRRTNKPPPLQQQSYVSNALSPIIDFVQDTEEKIPKHVALTVVRDVCSNALEQYRKFTYEVLSSVYKMEESLKRLKRARDRGAQSGSDVTGGQTDDDKIRLQIYLDVSYFGNSIESLGVCMQDIESYSALLLMATNAKEGKFVP